MKKLLLFFIVIIIGLSINFFKSDDIFSIPNINSVCFVADYSAVKDKNLDFVECGNDAIVFSNIEDAREIYYDLEPKCTVLSLQNTSLDQIKDLLKINYSFNQDLEGLTITYGYTPSFDKFQYVDGKKINVQIVEKSDEMLIGFPIIMTGY